MSGPAMAGVSQTIEIAAISNVSWRVAGTAR
jgi:hypothetical protein